jgi:hypothetical protein
MLNVADTCPARIVTVRLPQFRGNRISLAVDQFQECKFEIRQQAAVLHLLELQPSATNWPLVTTRGT